MKRVKNSMKSRVISSVLAAAMAFSAVPFGPITALAEETDTAASTAAVTTVPESETDGEITTAENTSVPESTGAEGTSVPETTGTEGTSVPDGTTASETGTDENTEGEDSESSVTDESDETTSETTVPTGFIDDEEGTASSTTGVVVGVEVVDMVMLEADAENLTVNNYNLYYGAEFTPVTEGMTIESGEPVTFHFNWSIDKSSGVVADKYEIQFDLMGISFSDATGPLMFDGKNVGTYTVDGDKVVLEFTDEALKEESYITGECNIQGITDYGYEDVTDEGKTQIGVKDRFVVTVDADLPGDISVDKASSGDVYKENDKYYQDYTITISSTGKGAVALETVADVFAGTGAAIDSSSIVVTPSGTVENLAGSYTDLASLSGVTIAPESSITVAYRAEVSANIMKEGIEGYKNDVTVTASEVMGDDVITKSDYAYPNVKKSANLSKSAKVSADGTKIEWTVYISSASFGAVDANGYATEPNHAENAALISNVKDSVYLNGVLNESVSITASDIINADTYSGNDWNPEYIYTYTTDIDPLSTFNDRDFKNTVSLDFDEVTLTGTASAFIAKGSIVDKTAVGSLNEETGEMNWEVKFTVPDEGVTKLILTDSIGSNHALTGDVAVSGVSGGYTVEDGTANVTFTEMPAPGTVITVTYKTAAPAGELVTSAVFTNNASLDFTVDGVDYTHTDSASFSHNVDTHIAKTASGVLSNEGEMDWMVNVTIPANATSITVSDSTSGGLVHSFVEGSLAVSGIDSADYSVNGSTVTLSTAIAADTPVTITYKTKAADGETEKAGKFINNASIDFVVNGKAYSQSDSAEYETDVVEIDALSKFYCWGEDGTGIDVRNVLLWNVSVDASKFPDGMKAGGVITIKDSFEAYNSLGVSFGDIVKVENSEYYSVSYNEGTSEFTVNILQDVPSDKSLSFHYTMTFDDYKAFLASGNSGYKNTVKGTYSYNGGDMDIGEASSEGWKAGSDGGVLGKDCDYTDGYLSGYTIRVNQDEIKLAAGDGYVTVTDTLGQYLMLDKSSVQIKDGDGNDVANASYTIDGQTITFTLPDETYCIITYNTAFSFVIEGGISLDKINSDPELKAGLANTVSIVAEGSDLDSEVKNWNTSVSNSNASVTAVDAELEINKYEQIDGSVFALENAVFTLVPGTFSSTSGNFEPFNDASHPVRTGTITELNPVIQELEFDVIYALSETTPPAGYTRDETVRYIVMRKIGTADPSLYIPANVSVTYIWCELGDKLDIQNFRNVNYFNKRTSDESYCAGATIEISAQEGQDLSNAEVENADSVTVNADSITYVSKTAAVIVSGLPAGKYVMTETAAPNGYTIADPITFWIGLDGRFRLTADETAEEGTYSLNMYNLKAGEVLISKQNADSEEIGGASLTVTDSNGDVVESWTSAAGESHKLTLSVGSYTLTETTAPQGYVVAESIEFTVNDDGTVTSAALENGKLVMVDDYEDYWVYIEKTDGDGSTVAGAVLAVLDENGSEVERWTTEEGVVKDLALPMGEYTLTEISAPDGYEKADDITFTVKADGTVESDALNVNGYIEMVDKKKKFDVEFAKADENGNKISGAKLELAKDGAFAAEWVSSADSTQTVKLVPGSYFLNEIETPEGYVRIDTVKFTVNDDGTITDIVNAALVDGVITITDKYRRYTVYIKKKDDTYLYVEGAVLAVLDENGSEVERWTTEEGVVKDLALPMGEYTLTEISAPDGYEKADDITFTVKADGTVESDALNVNGYIEMVDKKKKFDVEFAKADENGNKISGAKLELAKDGAFAAEWVSSADSTQTVKLVPGSYFLNEIETPEGYVRIDTVKFTVNDDGTITDIVNAALVDGVITITDKYRRYTVYIKKKDDTYLYVEGAVLAVLDENGSEVERWTTEEDAAKKLALPMGEYTLTEISAPEGYEKADDITFTVKADGIVEIDALNVNGNIEMVDKKVRAEVKFKKADPEGNYVVGAGLILYDSIRVVESWTTEDGVIKTLSLPVGSSYRLIEASVPEGYTMADEVTFTLNADGTVTNVVNGTYADGVITMVDGYADREVVISKQNIAGEEIGGAVLRVTNNTTGSYIEWTSVAGESKTIKLQPGTYTLTEKTAPDGYVVAESIEFTVNTDGTITCNNLDANGEIVMVDKYADTNVVISKQDIAGAEIAGAELTVTDENGKVVESWTSEKGKSKYLTLQPGTYTLTEKTAPQGYVVAESIEFTVNVDGTVTSNNLVNGKIVMVDAYADTDVVISKQDIAGAEIAGAELIVTDKDGKTVESWTSEAGKSKTIALQPGTYTLTEKTAPDGYVVAESVEFTVNAGGTITSNNLVDGKIVMVDKYADREVVISKQDIAGAEIGGAELTVTDKDGKTVESWTSEAGKSKTIALQPGTYTLTEKTAPQGYVVAESIEFTVNVDGTVTSNNLVNGKIVMVDAYADTDVVISKQDIAGAEIAGAELIVTDKDGKTVESWTSEAGKSKTIALQPGTYTLTEKTAPDGYIVAESISFTVNTDGTVTSNNLVDGKIVMVDKARSAALSKETVGGANLPGAAITVTSATGADLSKVTVTGASDVEVTSNRVTFVSGIKAAVLSKLPAGTYVMHEDTAPLGYALASDVEFTVAEDGTVTGVTVKDGKVVMVDEVATGNVVISKRSTSGQNLEGAVFDIAGSADFRDEAIVVSGGYTSLERAADMLTFKSGLTDTVIMNLPAGTYTITEISAPEGYVKSDEVITFVVDADGKVTVDGKVREPIIIENTPVMHDVTITKTDEAGNALAGAELKVVNNTTGEELSWTTDGSAKVLKLETGSYTLTEVSAPDGYRLAADIEFEVLADGTLKSGGRTMKAIRMIDKAEPSGGGNGGGSTPPTDDPEPETPPTDNPTTPPGFIEQRPVEPLPPGPEFVEPYPGYNPPPGDDPVEEDVSSGAGAETDEFAINVDSESPTGYVVTLIIAAAAGILLLRLRKKPRSRF